MSLERLVLTTICFALCVFCGFCYGVAQNTANYIERLTEKGWTIIPPKEEKDAE